MQSLKVRGPCGSLDFQTLLVLGPLQKLLLPFIFFGSVPFQSTPMSRQITVHGIGVIHKLRLQDKVGRLSKKICSLSTFIPQKMSMEGVLVVKNSQNLVNIVCEGPLT